MGSAAAHKTAVKPVSPGRRAAARAMKWIGGATAILSLIFGLQQLRTLLSENRKRNQQIEQALAVARSQESAGDFAAAWETLERAAKTPGAERELQPAQAGL